MIAISCRIDVFSSPNDGALTAATDIVPLTLFTISPANASLATSSAIINNGLFCAIAASKTFTISDKDPIRLL